MFDSFAPDPHALRAAAKHAVFTADGDHYPGVKAAVPRAYFEQVGAVIGQALRDVFDLADGAKLLGAWYQIVTTPPAQLTMVQRVPHFDATDTGRMALVHYLSPDDQGGTSFYRHRATGFEVIRAERVQGYFAALNAEIAAGSAPPPAYIADGAPWYERIARYEARFNRALLYPSWLLHSGAIPPGAALSADPMRGRLTVGTFLAAVQRGG